MKKQETIDKWYAEQYETVRAEAIEEKLDKMGFEGASNHIVSIACAHNDEDPVDFSLYSLNIEDEADMIRDFFKYLDENTHRYDRLIVGHNVVGFDLRVLRQRATVLGVKLPANIPWASKPWEMNPYDTMVQWTGSPRDYVKLDLLAKAFGVPGKQGMDGSKVYQAWKDGQIKEIAEYCRDVDVPMTRNVYQKMVEVLI